MRRSALGWGEDFASQTLGTPKEMKATIVARIASEDREGFDLFIEGEAGLEQARARLGGGLRYRTADPLDLPAVGDWVRLRPSAEGPWQIAAVYERRTALIRQAPGKATGAQVLAANVDVVFVVSSMNQEFEPRRLERYLVTVANAGAKPVLVLNKADLADDPQRYVAEAEAIAAGAPVVAVSALEDDDLEPLWPWLGTGQTVAVVGSSGVGKSTIINRLLGDEVQATSAIREDDDEGRHTTTARHLLVLPRGRGVLIDTPGIRELALWAGDGEADAGFEDVAALAAECRFRDCQHAGEPGCAVEAALAEGTLDADRLASWQKLQDELQRQAERQSIAARRAESRRAGRSSARKKKKKKK